MWKWVAVVGWRQCQGLRGKGIILIILEDTDETQDGTGLGMPGRRQIWGVRMMAFESRNEKPWAGFRGQSSVASEWNMRLKVKEVCDATRFHQSHVYVTISK